MNLLGNLRNIFWERNKSGENWYTQLSESEGFGLSGTNLEIAQNHPILTPALLFVSKLFSQAEFYMVNVKTGEKKYTHPLLELFNNPNYYQTKTDLLEGMMFAMIVNGVAVLYKKTIIGLEDEIPSIYLLDYNKITFPDNFTTPLSAANKNNKIGNTIVIYDKGEKDEINIKLKDLSFFYDMPNSLNTKNIYNVKSRLDGLKQTLVNTSDSLKAKNIILKTNGKEMLTGASDGFPLSDAEKEEAQRLMNNKYGLSSTRSRSFVTKANLTWKSLHIAIRDLGLDESVKVDGNLIYTALHISKDILSLEAKKTTYSNFKESMQSYIMNEMMSSINSFCEVINKTHNYKDWKLAGDYYHLPVMLGAKKEEYEIVQVQADALATLLASGVPEELALEMCGFQAGTKLEKPEPTVQTQATTQT